MVTNKDISKVKNRSLIIMGIGVVFFLIAGILLIAYGKENSKSENFDYLVSKKGNKYSLKASTLVYMISDPIEFGNDKSMAYYVIYNGQNYNIVYLSNKEYNKIIEKDIEREPVQLVGQSTVIDNDLKQKIMEYNNQNLQPGTEGYLDSKDFDALFGTIYLDTTKTKSENALLYLSLIYLFLGLGAVVMLFGILKFIRFNRGIKKYDETEYGFMELEMEEPETRKYEKYNLFLTSHYIIHLTNSFNACKYEDILWLYPEQKNNTVKGLKVLTKNGKTLKILSVRGTTTETDNMVLQEIWNTIYQKNHNIALGYTEENIARFNIKK